MGVEKGTPLDDLASFASEFLDASGDAVVAAVRRYYRLATGADAETADRFLHDAPIHIHGWEKVEDKRLIFSLGDGTQLALTKSRRDPVTKEMLADYQIFVKKHEAKPAEANPHPIRRNR